MYEDPSPPKYQKTLCKVAPQPPLAPVPSSYSKSKSSLIFPKQRKLIFVKIINYLPLKSTINGLLFESQVLRTSTAFPFGEIEVVVVAVVVVVVVEVVVGAEVGAAQSKSLQGQPAAQFS